MRAYNGRMLRSLAVIALLASTALAQPKDRVPPQKPPVIDMGEMEIGAKNRKVMLMTFLERAREELERASLEKRSFIPELIKTVDAETL